ncbi:RtcB family protein [Taibaiella soli]|uniref:3'-phosphate/5'-hydroxy nucleic acid ligase n=1 Tax=Taibaiella soli TaxID=1649169 RepID=A0A2W2C0D6_9BACT|nr:RtcB family protein [Taibaiella soli]PZF73533.1 RtcB family protein [Taibaiella soli]
MSIKLKELSKLGITTDIGRSLAINIISKHCKHETKEYITNIIRQITEDPAAWRNDEIWSKLANHLAPEEIITDAKSYELRTDSVFCKTYGGKYIDTNAKHQMNVALQLPVAVQGALMPDAHGGYGLPIGGVLATDNAIIPYAVGVDIGCRMALTIFNENEKYVQRYAYQIKQAIKEWTHFGMEGSLNVRQEHAVIDNPAFKEMALLRSLQGKAARQLGTSGGGNHFVEFGSIELYENNTLNIPAGNYLALLSHSGSRGLGANIAMEYTQIAKELCRLPREAQYLAWLDMNSEAGQEYWVAMTLAGDYAKACHDRIHANLTKALGLQPMALVENHHNFAWKETLNDREVIVHRKGATPAHEGELGIIPGSMTTPGYLVAGKGADQALNSASHGAGRALSRKRAKESTTQSALKKMLAQANVTLIGGSTEEAPTAYKDIDTVIEAQQDLITVQGKFQPRIVRMNKE